jgi:hypothetical protein
MSDQDDALAELFADLLGDNMGNQGERMAQLMADMFYEASPIKRRRANKAEMETRREGLLRIVAAMEPMTVRQVFYQATVHGLVEKTEAGYGQVQRELAKLRRDGRLPWGWIADNTRWQRKPRSYSDPDEALRHTARFYRKDLWSHAEDYVEIWCEKDALAGVLFEVTADYDVPLMVARGYASLSFLHSAAENIAAIDRPTFIYHLGDYDPSGQNAADKIEEELCRFCEDVPLWFERLAVTEPQIEAWDLPTRPTKKTDTRAKGFGKLSCELDSIDPHRLRDLVREAIERHLPPEQFRILKVAEESERELIHQWAGIVRGQA